MVSLRQSIERQWYSKPHWLFLLAPLWFLFIVVSFFRRHWLRQRAHKIAVPVIIVGNIAVGGTGKTPVIIALCKELRIAGYKPGVIARGYGVNLTQSRIVPEDARADEYGDEPVLVSKTTGCPVAVGPDRIASTHLLCEQARCNVILSDDGLQHYRLHRDVEVVIIDAKRLLGNGWRLPIGPLREGRSRLRGVDFILYNGQPQHSLIDTRGDFFLLQPAYWRNVQSGQTKALEELALDDAVAIAGIGNPQRFFDTLLRLGFTGSGHAYADHYQFTESDMRILKSKRVLMTEKDAVKCQDFASADWWALVVEAQLPATFTQALLQTIPK